MPILLAVAGAAYFSGDSQIFPAFQRNVETLAQFTSPSANLTITSATWCGDRRKLTDEIFNLTNEDTLHSLFPQLPADGIRYAAALLKNGNGYSFSFKSVKEWIVLP